MASGYTQGFTAFDPPYVNISFVDNIVMTHDAPQGVALYGATGGAVKGNITITQPIGAKDWQTGVTLQKSSGVVRCGNRSAAAGPSREVADVNCAPAGPSRP